MTNEILIIDDNLDIRLLISGILKDKGYVVREAANYDQAILEIKKKTPDVAVIDVKLDKGDNDDIELLTHLKKIDSEVFFLAEKTSRGCTYEFDPQKTNLRRGSSTRNVY